MPADSNVDLLGEFSEFYYMETEQDITASDALVLAYAWKRLCITDLDIPFNFAEHTFNDRCSAEMEEVAPGRMNFSLTFNLHQLRVPVADRQAWDDLYWSRKIIAVLALTAENDDPLAMGFVGNMVASQAQTTQPQEGPNTETYTLRPAARSQYDPTVRRIYGAGPWT